MTATVLNGGVSSYGTFQAATRLRQLAGHAATGRLRAALLHRQRPLRQPAPGHGRLPRLGGLARHEALALGSLPAAAEVRVLALPRPGRADPRARDRPLRRAPRLRNRHRAPRDGTTRGTRLVGDARGAGRAGADGLGVWVRAPSAGRSRPLPGLTRLVGRSPPGPVPSTGPNSTWTRRRSEWPRSATSSTSPGPTRPRTCGPRPSMRPSTSTSTSWRPTPTLAGTESWPRRSRTSSQIAAEREVSRPSSVELQLQHELLPGALEVAQVDVGEGHLDRLLSRALAGRSPSPTGRRARPCFSRKASSSP